MVIKWVPKSRLSRWSGSNFNGYGEYYNSTTCKILIGNFVNSVLSGVGTIVDYAADVDIYRGPVASGLKNGEFVRYHIEKSYWDDAVASLVQPVSVPAIKVTEIYSGDILQSASATSLVNLNVTILLDRAPFSSIARFAFLEM